MEIIMSDKTLVQSFNEEVVSMQSITKQFPVSWQMTAQTSTS
jgi:hypothetical protein